MIIKYKTNKGKSSLHFTCLPRIVGANTNTHTQRERERERDRRRQREKEGESGIDTVVLLFVSDGSGKDFRCRSQNGKKPTVIRWQDKEQENTKTKEVGGQASIGWGKEGSTWNANWAG